MSTLDSPDVALAELSRAAEDFLQAYGHKETMGKDSIKESLHVLERAMVYYIRCCDAQR
jgi:hypothetical protein